MALEDIEGPGKYLGALVVANPASSDDRREGDNHIRGIKNTLRNTFPNVNAEVTATAEELDAVREKVDRAGDTMTGTLQFRPATDDVYQGLVLNDAAGAKWGGLEGAKNPGPGGSELSLASGSAGAGNEGFITILTSGQLAMLIDIAGPVSVFSNATGGLLEVGYRNVPTVRILSELNGWIVPTDRGGLVKLSNQPQLNVDVMAAGDIVTLLNISGVTQTINTGPGFTLRITGSTTTGPRTLVDGAMVTIWWDDPSYAWISGSGLS